METAEGLDGTGAAENTVTFVPFWKFGIHGLNVPDDATTGMYWFRFALDSRKLLSSASDEKVLRVEVVVNGI